MNWEKIAKHYKSQCRFHVNYEDRFFVCPICNGEIYECDWRDADFTLGKHYIGKLYCPICEAKLFDEEE